MNKLTKSLVLLIVLSSLSKSIKACDVCGCSFGGYYFGIIPQYQSHFIGIRYNYVQFNAKIDNRFAEDEYSEDTFNRLELMGAYSINKKWQLSFVLPYVWNNMNGNLQQAKVTGVGDPSLLVLYNLINTGNDMKRSWNHALQVGGGLKFPLGKYQVYDENEILNRNFQVGSGSLDYLLTTNYVLKHDRMGVGIEASYKLNGRNKNDYRFGDQYNLGMNFFYWFGLGTSGLMPMAGLYYEGSAVHQEGKYTLDNTGGDVLLSNLGLQATVRQLTFNFAYQVPLYQRYHTDPISTIDSGSRFWIGVILSFRLKKEYSLNINDELQKQ